MSKFRSNNTSYQRSMVKTATNQNGDTKTATIQNGDTAIRRRPERRQTETATNQNGDTAVSNSYLDVDVDVAE